MKIIHSFSAFGEKRSIYMSFFPAIIRQHYTFFPYDNYKIYLYTDRPFSKEDNYGKELLELENINLIKIIIINGDNYWQKPHKGIGMIWRLMPIWENEIDYVFCRDLDSILTPRQTKFVIEFMKSNLPACGINDNNSHSIPLMGGMTGFKTDRFKAVTSFYSFENFITNSYKDSNWWSGHGSDQTYMMSILWPRIQNNFLLQRTTGPNERYSQKNNVPGISLDYLHEEVKDRGDDFTNYIGACSINGNLEDLINFYDKYGNSKYIEIIKNIEQKE